MTAPNTTYIVSLIVPHALRGSRLDVVAPGTGPSDAPIRGERGQVVAVTRFVQI
jgi:hypothetical protein